MKSSSLNQSPEGKVVQRKKGGSLSVISLQKSLEKLSEESETSSERSLRVDTRPPNLRMADTNKVRQTQTSAEIKLMPLSARNSDT